MTRSTLGCMAPPAAWQELAAEVAASLRERGLDPVQPFRVAWYNAQLADGAEPLPDLGRPDALGLLIGNTRLFWTPFRQAEKNESHLEDDPNPVDCYTCDAVHSALSVVEPRWVVRWAHVVEPEALPIQRIARATGLAMLSPSHLCVHEVHGPWIALRAVVVIDIAGPAGPAPSAPDPCTPCHKPCMAALQSALDARTLVDASAIERDWQAWLAIRDACPLGRESRYSDEQIRYHYTKRRSWRGE